MKKSLAALLMALLLCFATVATAEVTLLPIVEEWDLSRPVDIDLAAEVSVHMPFDEERCAQLAALLGHVSLRLTTTPGEADCLSRVALRVDDQDAAAFAVNIAEGRLQLSFCPGVTYSASGNALDTLLGSDAQVDLYGLDGSEHAWLNDAYALLTAVAADLEPYAKTASIKTAIENMGTARTKIVYTVPKAEAAVMGQALASNCVDGELKTLLMRLVYSGTQKLTLWLDADGAPLRADYAGNCGVDEEHLRKVSVVWRMRRDDTAVRDSLYVKTPGVRGTDYNTVNYGRKLTKGKNGKIVLSTDFTYNTRIDKQKTSRSGSIDLTATEKNGTTTLNGTVTLKQQLPGEDTAMSTKLQPELQLSSQNGIPVVAGSVRVQELRGKNVIEDAVITVRVSEGSAVPWDGSAAVVPAEQLTETELSQSLSAALLPHLVLLPADDTLYLSADLPEEVWQQIVDAARAALKEDPR